MDPMLESFLQESRDNLESVGRCFLALEKNADDNELMNDLFRSIHTIKGSSGLFDIAPLTRVVHAAEDVLDVVREGGLTLTPEHIDLFLDSMDQVSAWLDDLAETEHLPDGSEADGQVLAQQLRDLLGEQTKEPPVAAESAAQPALENTDCLYTDAAPDWLFKIPDLARIESYTELEKDDELLAIIYTPDEQCFFNGDDPLHTVQAMPGLRWFNIQPTNDWGEIESFDPFHCQVQFYILLTVKESVVREYLRYVAEQIDIIHLRPAMLILPTGEIGEVDVYELFVNDARALLTNNDFETLQKRITTLLEISSPGLIQTSALTWMNVLLAQETPATDWLGALINTVASGQFNPPEPTLNDKPQQDISPKTAEATVSASITKDNKPLSAAFTQIIETQLRILAMPCPATLLQGRLLSTVTVLTRLFEQNDWGEKVAALRSAGDEGMAQESCLPLYDYLQQCLDTQVDNKQETPLTEPVIAVTEQPTTPEPVLTPTTPAPLVKERRKTDRRRSGGETEPDGSNKSPHKILRVDQERIDMLMDLVGELVVAKNALPFLAKRADEDFKVKELGKEIKAQYSVINRLAEELQSAVMSVRMVPVSSVFQRFPRLVRDLSRRLEKNIQLVMEGEDTEADKNVIENLADPLIHLVRNSLDHGIELPQERRAKGKPEQGTLTLRAIPMDDQVIIEIIDDGKGIDPDIIKQKAYEKGIIDEAKLDTISNQEAVELIFAAGLSSKEEASDLSGRGVGMDVVRTAVIEAGGSVSIKSVVDEGTTLRLALPLSMAVAQVMMIEVDGQVYGVSMETIRETVRVPRSAIERVKHHEVIVLRDKLIPLRRLRHLLGLPDVSEAVEEEAILIVSYHGEEVGLVIDDFHEGIDVIQKPLEGVMSGFPIYAGATLLGDGRVLLILDLKELI